MEYNCLIMNINIPVSLGELIDKITILEIKQDKIKDSEKNKNITFELNLLNDKLNSFPSNNELVDLKNKLKEVNTELWDIEDQIRICEKRNNFDREFINLARNVYITNDKRFEIKNKINKKFSSDIQEVKSYEKY